MVSEDEPVIGFASALAWLVGMTIVIAILSEYVVGTIEVNSSLILFVSQSSSKIILFYKG